MSKFSDYCQGRDNNFNLIRAVAASLVLVSHAYPIVFGKGVLEPLQAGIGIKLGTLSVYVFFAISGFLISQSFERSSNLGRFVIARFLRIFPGLIITLCLTIFVLVPLVTTLPIKAYFETFDLASYFVRNVTLLNLQYKITGVFESNPFGGAINGSLWTLKLEIACYLAVFGLGLLGGITNKNFSIVFLASFALMYLAVFHSKFGNQLSHSQQRLVELGLPFAIGMMFYIWRDKITLRWSVGVAIAAGAAVVQNSPIFHIIFVLALSYWTFLLAYLPRGTWHLYNQLGDYSYGIYIYAFPIQQLAAHYFSPLEPWQNMVIAAPITLAMAVLSWHLVEKPALGYKSILSTKLSRLQKSVVGRW